MGIKSSNYYLGLDIGTDSIGWAVTDEEYRIQKFNGNAMWGIRLFDGGNTALDRRLQRTARRRTQRKVQRIKLIQEIFSEEISKVDPGFYLRLSESKYHLEDRTLKQSNTLFNDDNFDDKIYHKRFPTIYHLRHYLMNAKEKVDIRLLYLAVHHIVKHRGHFLFEGETLEVVDDVENILRRLTDYLYEEMDIQFKVTDIDTFKGIMSNTSLGINERKSAIEKTLEEKNSTTTLIVKLLAGAKVKVKDIFGKGSIEDESVSLQFGKSDSEEMMESLFQAIPEKIILIEYLKSIYDWGLLQQILNGKKSISKAKVNIYDQHHDDLQLLKKMTRKYISEKYDEIFNDTETNGNYVSYVGYSKHNGKKIQCQKTCTQEELIAYLKKCFKDIENEDSEFNLLNQKLLRGNFLPKQVNKDNGVIPQQLQAYELKMILANQTEHYPFLRETDETGFNGIEKIIKIHSFRIPYYVGPINPAHKQKDVRKGHCWVSIKGEGPIRPWNFERIVDVEKSGQDFIRRMTNKCTYLIGADVLPKDSLLYSEFMVLNELNNVRLDGIRIDNELKSQVVEDLFKKKKRVTAKIFKQYLKTIHGIDSEITGIDGDFKSSLASSIEIRGIIGDDRYQIEMVENLILSVVLFGDDKRMLRRRIKREYGSHLTENQITQIANLKYSGWGRLSRELLEQIAALDKENGDYPSIIELMRRKSVNLMELLGREYGYTEKIIEFNDELTDSSEKFSYDLVEELYISPKVKRGVWQTLQIIDEIVKIKKQPPAKIFVEMARGPEEKKRTDSRKKKLMDLYKACKAETRNWLEELDKKTEAELRSDKLYLYYTQMGRCMYTNEPISLFNLFDKNLYDIDHIYPQSRIKDDSLNNRVLVKKNVNYLKSDMYPLSDEIRNSKNKAFWNSLVEKGFITKEKYNRLVRSTGFSAEELAEFISRQIVETRQSTKAVTQLIRKVYSQTAVVYVKAKSVSDFRHQFKLIKLRDINDLHHAKDAYLNIVVGNVYDVKFTRNPVVFFRNSNNDYNIKRLFEFDVRNNQTVAWKSGESGTISIVKRQMAKNNILFTRYAYEKKGQLFDLMPMRKGKGQMPLKGSDKRLQNIKKYGGYNSIKGAYFSLVEYSGKGKITRKIVYIPIHLSEAIKKNPEVQIDFLKESLEVNELKILVPKIKMNTLFKIDGFPMHIAGRTDERLVFKSGVQLIIDEKEIIYLKKVFKYHERVEASKKFKEMITEPTLHDEVTPQDNLRIFKLFFEKLQNSIYANVKQLSELEKLFKNGESKFTSLSLNDQCELLVESVNLFHCRGNLADLRLIGGSGHAGLLRKNSIIMKKSEKLVDIKMIHQSPTGLFKREVDLNKI